MLLQNGKFVLELHFIAAARGDLDYLSNPKDCFDLSLEALEFYSRAFPDSTLAANIKACNVFRLFEDGNAALEVIDELCENVLIAHNRVVFQDGQTALKVWPGLVGKIPEARLNLAIYFLRQGETEAAAELMDGVEASCPQSHALLGLLNAETSRSPESLEKAQSHFQSVGSNPSECDTILGRQCMASSLILQKKHEEALVYLGVSISHLSLVLILSQLMVLLSLSRIHQVLLGN
jgi:intraflagellar transport protein 56